ncbi:Mechanosensitive ion channel protein 8 [Linum perenne]
MNKDYSTVDVDKDAAASTPSTSPTVRREPSFGFSSQSQEDPPTRMIHQFLSQQQNSGEISLDMDMEMDELKALDEMPQPSHINHPGGSPMSRRSSIRVSFADTEAAAAAAAAAESLRWRHKEHNQTAPSLSPSHEAVIRCTSNKSFRKQASSLSRLKTKSRLLDPPEDQMGRMSEIIAKSGQLYRSGMMSKTGDEDDDDDLELEDFPDDFRKTKMNFSTILQWVTLIAIIIALFCSLLIPSLEKKMIAQLRLWKWEVLLLVLICGRLVSGWGIRILVYLVERNFLLRKRVLYFVYGLKNGVQNCLWLGLVLLAWMLLFDKKVEQEARDRVIVLKYLTKFLVCCLVANFIWLLKTLLVKVLASSFHVSTYFDRIQESLFNQFVIETLSGPPLIEQQRTQEDMERTAAEVKELQNAGANMPPDLRETVGGKSFMVRENVSCSSKVEKKGDDLKKNSITIDHLHQLNTKNVSAWNMKRLINIVRHGSLSTLDEQILQGANRFEDDQSRKIKSEYEAKAAARKIFYNVAALNSRYIYFEDLMRFMREEEALKTMSFFEGASETSRISKSSLKNWVVNAFRERRALALTLNDTKTAVNKLHQMVNVIVSVIIVIISLLLLGIAPSKFFVLLGSQLVVVSFIFGNTCKTLFESIIFLFIVHPYDLIVEEMNILTTVFLRGDNQKVVYHNNILATKSIGNYYRSPDMGDAIEFLIHVTTPADKVAVMKQRIISYIESKKEHWYPSPMVITKDVEGLTSVRMAVWFRHRINHQDMGEKFSRRATLVEELIKIFKELDIQHRLHPLDVNIRQVSPLPPLPFTTN